MRPPTCLERVDCMIGNLGSMIDELEYKVLPILTHGLMSEREVRELETACIALTRAQARLRRVVEGQHL
ncbi:MAG: hypothetical protein EOO40_02610 [Deltaproteobacteria bacterium]|nr:MAG: hypothetical protein EOO40_02610 [Deltaproteobacteria bacterium]